MRRPLVLAALAAVALTGCAAVPEPAPTNEGTVAGTVTVFAAASLTESFQAIADAFTAEHPNVQVTFNFGGSSGLATQIVEGAPADVFAAASPATMTTVTDAGLATDPADFATNTLEIAVPTDNPGGVTGLADFANPDLAIALCAAEVPCGAAAAKALDAAGIVASVDTYEQDVRAVLTKIELGEVDAGLVYRTDVLAAGAKVKGIEFPEASGAIARYPIAALTASANPDSAAAFAAFVLSDAGQRILQKAGFGAP
ncbi:MAG: molybdate ABC transporter substrate-binding protein [Actinobacteria bacterium]|nr:molybdate ABC transporter substrate-binding protein [Actinomycetota bacterium]